MKSSSGRINISACAPTIRVDNRISLWRYLRMADNLLKQADIFREEKNVIDLYVMLLRFSSLVSETIPCHREYRASPQNQKVALKKKMLNAVNELEDLKPALQSKLNELERRNTNQTAHPQPASRGLVTYQDPRSRNFSSSRPVEVQLRKFSISTPYPKAETLSKHSFLGPNGLHPQFQPPISNKGVQYPSNIDLTPVEIPSLQPSQVGQKMEKDSKNSELEPSNLESSEAEKNESQTSQSTEPNSLISFEEMEIPVENNIRQPSPPPVLAEVQDLVPTMPSQVTEAECRLESTPQDVLASSGAPLQLHISTELMENFMRMAKSNTDKNLETCGVLAGSLKNRKFYVTALIIPKQESTSDSCQTMNEEEIFEVQDKQSLFPLGWIHTHPTQSCFMSSIDVHTHYSYQIMLPEAVAIVMAPRDSSRKHGIFRLTTPGGMAVIRGCDKRGFHPHEPPTDGGPIYKQCTDVYMNPNLRFDVIDLR